MFLPDYSSSFMREIFMAALKPDDSNHPMADPSAGPVLPAAYSVLAVEPLLSEVERLYRLVSPSTGQLLRSWANDVYEVATTTERYVLKVYRDRWRSADEVIWEAELQAYLLGQWVPVAPIVPRPRGELTGSVRAPDGERTVTLTRYVQGALSSDSTVLPSDGSTLRANSSSI